MCLASSGLFPNREAKTLIVCQSRLIVEELLPSSLEGAYEESVKCVIMIFQITALGASLCKWTLILRKSLLPTLVFQAINVTRFVRIVKMPAGSTNNNPVSPDFITSTVLLFASAGLSASHECRRSA